MERQIFDKPADDIISYTEMCNREGRNLQRGMNFNPRDAHSVILMSVRAGAPYHDRVLEDGSTIIYEGHDVLKSQSVDPKSVDQPEAHSSGELTENGRFLFAARQFLEHKTPPRRVRVYEKLRTGIWSYNGVFHLVDGWVEVTEKRRVFKFKLTAVEETEAYASAPNHEVPHRRIIPTHVKIEVMKRDGGVCAFINGDGKRCGSNKNLHFDHDLPFSLGGSSLTAENIQLLCAQHNLRKHNKIF